MRASPSAEHRPHATVLGSLLEGWRRAIRAPWLAVGVVALGWMFAEPLAATIGLPALSFRDRPGLVPGLVGIDATLQLPWQQVDTGAWLVKAALAGYVTFWAFLTGGLIDRLARARPIGTAAFFAACGGHAGRFLRLSVVTALTSGALGIWILPDVLAAGWGLERVLGLLVFTAVHLVFDVTRVRLVVEDRRSVLGALAAGVRFVRRRPLRLLVLYAITMLVMTAATGSLSGLLPAADAATPTFRHAVPIAFVTLVLVWVRLAWIATLTAFFQLELAHAQYTATPLPAWPDSASVEAIRNLKR